MRVLYSFSLSRSKERVGWSRGLGLWTSSVIWSLEEGREDSWNHSCLMNLQQSDVESVWEKVWWLKEGQLSFEH